MNEEQVCVVGRRRSRHEVEQVVAEFESSGLSRIEFCRQRGLALSTLGRYRKRQERQAPTGSSALGRRGIRPSGGAVRRYRQHVGGGAARRAANRSGAWVRY